MRNFRELNIWQQSMKFALNAYTVTSQLPKEEEYGLKRQIKGAVVSIASNIAEGCSRTSQKEFRHYLEISLGSAFEAETQIILARQLEMLTEEQENQCILVLQQLQKSINAFIRSTKDFT